MITVVNEYRSAGALDLLTAALRDKNESIWKAALDGPVTLGGGDVVRELVNAMRAAEAQKQDWLREALQQVRIALTKCE